MAKAGVHELLPLEGQNWHFLYLWNTILTLLQKCVKNLSSKFQRVQLEAQASDKKKKYLHVVDTGVYIPLNTTYFIFEAKKQLRNRKLRFRSHLHSWPPSTAHVRDI